jgi:hypothetical protein
VNEGSNLPVRLMQLGDLFDFWIGLKCPFSLLDGASWHRRPGIGARSHALRRQLDTAGSSRDGTSDLHAGH